MSKAKAAQQAEQHEGGYHCQRLDFSCLSADGYVYAAVKFWWYTLYILLTLLYYTYYGLFAIVVAPSLQVSSVACTIFYALWNLFSGVLITLPEMPVSH